MHQLLPWCKNYYLNQLIQPILLEISATSLSIIGAALAIWNWIQMRQVGARKCSDKLFI